MDIETQKKGNGSYYYLKHTLRHGNKVRTKRKYLGKQIPEDIENIKAEFYREINKDVFEKLERIKKNFQNEWKKLPQAARERELQELAIAFTYNTNAIEGSTITLFETREILMHRFAPAKALDDIEETKAHGKVFLELLRDWQKPSMKLILEWHRMLFSQTKPELAGVLREYLVRVGSYIVPHPEDMKEMLEELDVFFATEHLHPVEFAGRVHYIFEKIHPFGDGNGRVGRLLMNHILWLAGYPMVIIEYKNRKAYYRALEKDEQSFAEYFIKLYLKVHKKRYLEE